MVSSLDFRYEGQLVSLLTQVYEMGTGDMLLEVTLRWTGIPSRGE